MLLSPKWKGRSVIKLASHSSCLLDRTCNSLTTLSAQSFQMGRTPVFTDAIAILRCLRYTNKCLFNYCFACFSFLYFLFYSASLWNTLCNKNLVVTYILISLENKMNMRFKDFIALFHEFRLEFSTCKLERIFVSYTLLRNTTVTSFFQLKLSAITSRYAMFSAEFPAFIYESKCLAGNQTRFHSNDSHDSIG